MHRCVVLIGRLESIFAPYFAELVIDRPIFIIGAPRSGTTLLYKIVMHHPDVAYLTQASDLFPECPIFANYLFRKTRINKIEPDSVGSLEQWTHQGFNYAEGFNFWWYFSRPLRQFVLDVENVNDEQQTFYRRAVQKHLYMFKRLRFINKAPLNSLRIGYLNHIFPNALFIHIHRDGRAVARSILEQRIRHGDPRDSWGPQPIQWAQFETQEPLIVCGLQWKYILQRIRESLALIPAERHFTLKYDSLTANPESAIRDLLSFCDLHEDKKVLSAIPHVRSMDYKWRDEMSVEEAYKLKRAIGDTLDQWGYKSS